MAKYNPIVGDKWRYDPKSPAAFKLSRTKIELFCKCERCFYLEVRLGFREPSGPGWAINSAVDTLLKKEMDYCRKEDRPHGLFKEYDLNIKPFNHPDIEQWQNSFKGIQYVHPDFNLLIYGGVDDIMVNEKEELVVIDFKATAKRATINSRDDVWGRGEAYKRQLEIYSWLLQKNGFNVSKIGYLMYYNGEGVLLDFVYAHMWADISASKGSGLAMKLLKLLTEKMNSTQIAEAHVLAKKCIDKNYNDC